MQCFYSSQSNTGGVFVADGVGVRVSGASVNVAVGGGDVFVADGVKDAVGVLDGVGVIEGVWVVVGIGVSVGIDVAVGVLVFVGVSVLVGVLLGVGVTSEREELTVQRPSNVRLTDIGPTRPGSAGTLRK